jgi:hypothetical protein
MTQKPVSARTSPSNRKSGTLSLFTLEPAPESAPGPADGSGTESGVPAARGVPPYARFRLCRGFIDDLNRILPIRMRIQLESDLANGRTRGQVEGPLLRFRWEFLEH